MPTRRDWRQIGGDACPGGGRTPLTQREMKRRDS